MKFIEDIPNDPLFYLLSGLGIFALLIWYLVSDLDAVKRRVGSFLVALVLVVSFIGFFTQGIKKGIDLQGGTSLTLVVQPKVEGADAPTKEALEQARAIVRKRLEGLDWVDPSTISTIIQEPSRLLVQVPGISPEEQERTKEEVTRIASLEILQVHPDNAKLVGEERRYVSGWQSYDYKFTDREGNERNETLWLSKRGKLTGKNVERATVDPSRRGVVQVRLNNDGAAAMRDITSRMRVGVDRLAVVLDGRVVVAPTVNATLSREFIIEGLDDAGEAENVANSLNNPLDNPLIVEEVRDVSATLGAKTIEQGIMAGLIGLGLTVVLILVCYRFAGIIALCGLAINIIVLFGAMAIFNFVFTLPGIAGVILTIGMAVDANVLIFERLREERAAGKSIGGAIRAAYEKAFSAIFDANVTTLITALILFWRASGTVKGFAITLTLGIIASMFAALIVTRILFFYLNGTKAEDKMKKLNFTKVVPESHIQFLGMRKLSLTISGILVLLSCLVMGVRGEKSLGVDFVGGALITYQMGDSEITEAQIREVAEAQELSKVPFTQEERTVAGDRLVTVRLSDELEDVNTVTSAVDAAYPGLSFNQELVGSALGTEFLKTSLIALAIGLLGILVYISLRFEFSFALGALVALFHDLIICIGIVALAGGEFNLIHVGAILTIAGYSINDTIVVFDRIRETLMLRGGSVASIMNEAINSTLSRTVLTSITTFAAVTMLYFLGGPALKDFSFTIMIGVIVGTYSSIFVAAPAVLILSRKRNLRDEILEAERAAMTDDVEVIESKS